MRSPPHLVAQALTRLGANLRVARVRRKLRIRDVAEKIGTGPRAVMDAEKGKPSTSIGVYVALLWAYDLLSPLHDLANPNADELGLTLASRTERSRVRTSKGLSGDF